MAPIEATTLSSKQAEFTVFDPLENTKREVPSLTVDNLKCVSLTAPGELSMTVLGTATGGWVCDGGHPISLHCPDVIELHGIKLRATSTIHR